MTATTCFRKPLWNPFAVEFIGTRGKDGRYRTFRDVMVGNAGASWFLDGSVSPYRIDSNNLDGLPVNSDAGQTDLTVAVWMPGPQKVLELPAKYCVRGSSNVPTNLGASGRNTGGQRNDRQLSAANQESRNLWRDHGQKIGVTGLEPATF